MMYAPRTTGVSPVSAAQYAVWSAWARLKPVMSCSIPNTRTLFALRSATVFGTAAQSNGAARSTFADRLAELLWNAVAPAVATSAAATVAAPARSQKRLSIGSLRYGSPVPPRDGSVNTLRRSRVQLVSAGQCNADSLLLRERVGARDDFQDLLRDLGLARPVHREGQRVDQLARVLRGVPHRRHTRALLGRGRLEQGPVQLRLDVNREQPDEDLL